MSVIDRTNNPIIGDINGTYPTGGDSRTSFQSAKNKVAVNLDNYKKRISGFSGQSATSGVYDKAIKFYCFGSDAPEGCPEGWSVLEKQGDNWVVVDWSQGIVDFGYSGKVDDLTLPVDNSKLFTSTTEKATFYLNEFNRITFNNGMTGAIQYGEDQTRNLASSISKEKNNIDCYRALVNDGNNDSGNGNYYLFANDVIKIDNPIIEFFANTGSDASKYPTIGKIFLDFRPGEISNSGITFDQMYYPTLYFSKDGLTKYTFSKDCETIYDSLEDDYSKKAYIQIKCATNVIPGSFTSIGDTISLVLYKSKMIYSFRLNPMGGSFTGYPNLSYMTVMTFTGEVVNSGYIPTVTKSGKTFGGWFKESSCVNQWNFSTDRVSQNTTVYAKWN